MLKFKFSVKSGLKQEVFRNLVESPIGLGELRGRKGLLKAGKVPLSGRPLKDREYQATRTAEDYTPGSRGTSGSKDGQRKEFSPLPRFSLLSRAWVAYPTKGHYVCDCPEG